MIDTENRLLEMITHSPEETMRLGEKLGEFSKPGDVYALYGELGAGKTHIVKGISKGAGFPHTQDVTSPTFVLVHEYAGRMPIYHIDAYRLGGADELEDLGAEEFFFGEGMCLIEWADRVEDCLPAARLDIFMEHAGPESRKIRIIPHEARYIELARNLLQLNHFKETDQ